MHGPTLGGPILCPPTPWQILQHRSEGVIHHKRHKRANSHRLELLLQPLQLRVCGFVFKFQKVHLFPRSAIQLMPQGGAIQVLAKLAHLIELLDEEAIVFYYVDLSDLTVVLLEMVPKLWQRAHDEPFDYEVWQELQECLTTI